MNIDKFINSVFGSSDEIWSAIKKYALIGSREATKMMLQMYYCLKSPTTPAFDKMIIVAGLGYQLLPKDALPVEKYKFLGLLDNGITLLFAYNKVRENVTPEISSQVDRLLDQWFHPDKEKDDLFSPLPTSPIPFQMDQQVSTLSDPSQTADASEEDDLIVD